MPPEKTARVPFDDRAALEELERLQRSIQEYRRKREQAEGEFEEFIGGFRPVAGQSGPAPADQVRAFVPISPDVANQSPLSSPRPVDVEPAPPASVPVPQIPVVAPVVPAAIPPAEPIMAPWAPPPAIAVPPSFFSEAPRSVTFDDGTSDVSPATIGTTRSRLPLILGAAGVLLVAAVLLTRSMSSPVSSLPPAAAPEPAPAPAEAPAPVAPPETTAAKAASPPAAAAPAPAPPAEIRTLRRVWLRVLVDGTRAVEREVEANASIPLPAGRTFIVRAGDAGAVHFYMKGQDRGPLGADAQVVTRTFTSGIGSAPAPVR